MRFETPLVAGRLIKRYKRFFVDVQLDGDGEVVTAHCPNTGSLRGCLQSGAPVLLQPVDDPKRKLRWTWRMVHTGDSWVGIDSALANRLVTDALQAGHLPALSGYERILPEVPYGGDGRSRIDLLLSTGGRQLPGKGSARARYEDDERTYVEVKSTTMTLEREGRRLGAFPDAVTERGRKHLRELLAVVQAGHRAAMVFAVQRSDCEAFVPADAIDPAYGQALREVCAQGVEAYALAAELDPHGVELRRPLEVLL